MAVQSPVRTQRFNGFPPGGFEFFLELQAQQSREWFHANKQRYETVWVKPLEALLEDLTERLSDVFPEMPRARRHIFRIQRDIRFAADKSPYKTHIAGHVAVRPTAGEGESWVPSLYVHFSLDYSVMSMGNWMVDKDVLLRFRQKVSDDKTGAPLQRTIDRLLKEGLALAQHETFKRVPPPYPQDHPRAELLKRKDLSMHVPEIPEDLMPKPELLDWLDERMHKLTPIAQWLDRELRPVAIA